MALSKSATPPPTVRLAKSSEQRSAQIKDNLKTQQFKETEIIKIVLAVGADLG
jgi:hypothetical protein